MNQGVEVYLLNTHPGGSLFAEYVLGSHRSQNGCILDRKPHREDKAIDYVFRTLDIRFYYLIAALIGAAVWKTWRWEGNLLVGNVFFLLAKTVLIRKVTPRSHLQPELFWSWKQWSVQKNQILTNIVLFVSAGVLVGKLWRLRGIRVALALSFAIEFLQLLSRRGLCEMDDVIHNVVGGLWELELRH